MSIQLSLGASSLEYLYPVQAKLPLLMTNAQTFTKPFVDVAVHWLLTLAST